MMSAEVLQVRVAYHEGVGKCSMFVNIAARSQMQCHVASRCVCVDA